MLNKYAGYLLATTAVLLWSFNIIYAKILPEYLTPVQISFIRWMLAALFFLPFTAKSIYTHRRYVCFLFRGTAENSPRPALFYGFDFGYYHLGSFISAAVCGTALYAPYFSLAGKSHYYPAYLRRCGSLFPEIEEEQAEAYSI